MKVELLAPGGSYETVIAALNAGADAVYTGGEKFGARANADNLTIEQLKSVIDYAHLHGRKIYLTVNTLLKENEIKKELYEMNHIKSNSINLFKIVIFSALTAIVTCMIMMQLK